MPKWKDSLNQSRKGEPVHRSIKQSPSAKDKRLLYAIVTNDVWSVCRDPLYGSPPYDEVRFAIEKLQTVDCPELNSVAGQAQIRVLYHTHTSEAEPRIAFGQFATIMPLDVFLDLITQAQNGGWLCLQGSMLIESA